MSGTGRIAEKTAIKLIALGFVYDIRSEGTYWEGEIDENFELKIFERARKENGLPEPSEGARVDYQNFKARQRSFLPSYVEEQIVHHLAPT